MESTGAIAKKLVAAMNDIDAVTKSGTNEKHGYKYVKAADVANEVRKVLVRHGIAFDYDVISSEHWEKTTNAGGILYFCQLEIAITFTDSDTGESRSVKGIGWGADSMDKAPYKAMTGALKYALRMNFIIPDESDPENGEDIETRPQKQVQAVQHDEREPEEEIDRALGTKPPPKRQAVAKGQNDVQGEAAISEGKAKRFIAIALTNGKSRDQIGEALASYGLSDIKCCPWKGKTYDNLIAWAQNAN